MEIIILFIEPNDNNIHNTRFDAEQQSNILDVHYIALYSHYLH